MAMLEKNAAVVLCAGRGRRMQSSVPKQFMDLCGSPVICHSLRAFEDFDEIDEIILVAGRGEEDYCRREIIEKYNFSKVKKIITGGAERYNSVYEGLKAVPESFTHVFIHDGARPLVDRDILKRCLDDVRKYHACVCAVPSKDTVKIADESGFVCATPDRAKVWIIQTPQVFDRELILDAYRKVMQNPAGITDDASAVERAGTAKIRLTEGSYENIKITTPEDLTLAEQFQKRRKKQG